MHSYCIKIHKGVRIYGYGAPLTMCARAYSRARARDVYITSGFQTLNFRMGLLFYQTAERCYGYDAAVKEGDVAVHRFFASLSPFFTCDTTERFPAAWILGNEKSTRTSRRHVL